MYFGQPVADGNAAAALTPQEYKAEWEKLLMPPPFSFETKIAKVIAGYLIKKKAWRHSMTSGATSTKSQTTPS